MIFLGSDAPPEATSPDEIAQIEDKDNEAKVQRVESLIKESVQESEDEPGDEERWREVAQRLRWDNAQQVEPPGLNLGLTHSQCPSALTGMDAARRVDSIFAHCASLTALFQ